MTTAREDLIETLGRVGDLLHEDGCDPSDPEFYTGLADGLPTKLLRRGRTDDQPDPADLRRGAG